MKKAKRPLPFYSQPEYSHAVQVRLSAKAKMKLPDDYGLLKLLRTHSKAEVMAMFGVSRSQINKRIRRLGKARIENLLRME